MWKKKKLKFIAKLFTSDVALSGENYKYLQRATDVFECVQKKKFECESWKEQGTVYTVVV